MDFTKMAIYSITDKEIVLNLYNGLVFWDKNEYTTALCINSDELTNQCWMKEGSHRRISIVWFHYEKFKNRLSKIIFC